MIYTNKQKELIKLIQEKDITLADGGSRSGKTFCMVRSIFNRAMAAANSWHLILRATQINCYQKY